MDNEHHATKTFLVRNGITLLMNIITIIAFIVMFSTAWGKLGAQINFHRALIDETRLEIKVLQAESKANAVQFAEIQKDLTEIRKDLGSIQVVLIDLRDRYIRAETK